MLGSCSRSVLTMVSTAMIFNSSSCARAQYIHMILDAKLLSSYSTLRTHFFWTHTVYGMGRTYYVCTCVYVLVGTCIVCDAFINLISLHAYMYVMYIHVRT